MLNISLLPTNPINSAIQIDSYHSFKESYDGVMFKAGQRLNFNIICQDGK